MLRARSIAMALAATAALACGNTAVAADGADRGLGLTVGITGGTLGLGPELGFRINRMIGVRAGLGSLNVNEDGEEDEYDYEGKVKLKSTGVMADIYPFGGSFRVSLGMRSNKNRVNASIMPTEDIEIDGQEFDDAAVGTLNGEVNFKKSSPTLTIGWGGDISRGLHFGLDLGVMKQGSPQVSVTNTGSLATDQGATGQQFRARLAQEVADAEDEAKDYKFWPVLQLHLSYSF
jgi:hypothetical protein